MPPDAPRAAAKRLPRARMSLYDGVGHAVMAKAPDRFNPERADLVAGLA